MPSCSEPARPALGSGGWCLTPVLRILDLHTVCRNVVESCYDKALVTTQWLKNGGKQRAWLSTGWLRWNWLSEMLASGPAVLYGTRLSFII